MARAGQRSKRVVRVYHMSLVRHSEPKRLQAETAAELDALLPVASTRPSEENSNESRGK